MRCRDGELIGYARCSTVLQDLTAQRQALAALGVPDDRIYLDKASPAPAAPAPSWTRPWPGVRSSDTLVAPKLDRLACSVPDARPHRRLSLVARGIKLSLGGTIYDPANPLRKMFSTSRRVISGRRAQRTCSVMTTRRLSAQPPGIWSWSP